MNCLKMSAKECEDKVVLHELKEIWPNELSEEDIRFRRFFFPFIVAVWSLRPIPLTNPTDYKAELIYY